MDEVIDLTESDADTPALETAELKPFKDAVKSMSAVFQAMLVTEKLIARSSLDSNKFERTFLRQLKENTFSWIRLLLPEIFDENPERRKCGLRLLAELRKLVPNIICSDHERWPELREFINKHTHVIETMVLAGDPLWGALWEVYFLLVGNQLTLKSDNKDLTNQLFIVLGHRTGPVSLAMQLVQVNCWRAVIDAYFSVADVHALSENNVKNILKYFYRMTGDKELVCSKVKLLWYVLTRLTSENDSFHLAVDKLFESYGPKVKLVPPYKIVPEVYMEILALVLGARPTGIHVFSIPSPQRPFFPPKSKPAYFDKMITCFNLAFMSQCKATRLPEVLTSLAWDSLLANVISFPPEVMQLTMNHLMKTVFSAENDLLAHDANIQDLRVSILIAGMVNGPSCLPDHVLLDRKYFSGSSTQDLLNGTPALFLSQFLLEKSVVLQCDGADYLPVIKTILCKAVKCPETSEYYTRKVLNLLDILATDEALAEKLPVVFNVWTYLTTYLAEFLAGNKNEASRWGERDFDWLYSIVLFPIKYFEEANSGAIRDSFVSIGVLLKAVSEANIKSLKSNVICETLSKRLLQLLTDHPQCWDVILTVMRVVFVATPFRKLLQAFPLTGCLGASFRLLERVRKLHVAKPDVRNAMDICKAVAALTVCTNETTFFDIHPIMLVLLKFDPNDTSYSNLVEATWRDFIEKSREYENETSITSAITDEVEAFKAREHQMVRNKEILAETEELDDETQLYRLTPVRKKKNSIVVVTPSKSPARLRRIIPKTVFSPDISRKSNPLKFSTPPFGNSPTEIGQRTSGSVNSPMQELQKSPNFSTNAKSPVQTGSVKSRASRTSIDFSSILKSPVHTNLASSPVSRKSANFMTFDKSPVTNSPAQNDLPETGSVNSPVSRKNASTLLLENTPGKAGLRITAIVDSPASQSIAMNVKPAKTPNPFSFPVPVAMYQNIAVPEKGVAKCKPKIRGPLTKRQKEKMRERRDNIPALYGDLTQDSQPDSQLSSSQDTSSIVVPERFKQSTTTGTESEREKPTIVELARPFAGICKSSEVMVEKITQPVERPSDCVSNLATKALSDKPKKVYDIFNSNKLPKLVPIQLTQVRPESLMKTLLPHHEKNALKKNSEPIPITEFDRLFQAFPSPANKRKRPNKIEKIPVEKSKPHIVDNKDAIDDVEPKKGVVTPIMSQGKESSQDVIDSSQETTPRLTRRSRVVVTEPSVIVEPKHLVKAVVPRATMDPKPTATIDPKLTATVDLKPTAIVDTKPTATVDPKPTSSDVKNAKKAKQTNTAVNRVSRNLRTPKERRLPQKMLTDIEWDKAKMTETEVLPQMAKTPSLPNPVLNSTVDNEHSYTKRNVSVIVTDVNRVVSADEQVSSVVPGRAPVISVDCDVTQTSDSRSTTAITIINNKMSRETDQISDCVIVASATEQTPSSLPTAPKTVVDQYLETLNQKRKRELNNLSMDFNMEKVEGKRLRKPNTRLYSPLPDVSAKPCNKLPTEVANRTSKRKRNNSTDSTTSVSSVQSDVSSIYNNNVTDKTELAKVNGADSDSMDSVSPTVDTGIIKKKCRSRKQIFEESVESTAEKAIDPRLLLTKFDTLPSLKVDITDSTTSVSSVQSDVFSGISNNIITDETESAKIDGADSDSMDAVSSTVETGFIKKKRRSRKQIFEELVESTAEKAINPRLLSIRFDTLPSLKVDSLPEVNKQKVVIPSLKVNSGAEDSFIARDNRSPSVNEKVATVQKFLDQTCDVESPVDNHTPDIFKSCSGLKGGKEVDSSVNSVVPNCNTDGEKSLAEHNKENDLKTDETDSLELQDSNCVLPNSQPAIAEIKIVFSPKRNVLLKNSMKSSPNRTPTKLSMFYRKPTPEKSIVVTREPEPDSEAVARVVEKTDGLDAEERTTTCIQTGVVAIAPLQTPSLLKLNKKQKKKRGVIVEVIPETQTEWNIVIPETQLLDTLPVDSLPDAKLLENDSAPTHSQESAVKVDMDSTPMVSTIIVSDPKDDLQVVNDSIQDAVKTAEMPTFDKVPMFNRLLETSPPSSSALMRELSPSVLREMKSSSAKFVRVVSKGSRASLILSMAAGVKDATGQCDTKQVQRLRDLKKNVVSSFMGEANKVYSTNADGVQVSFDWVPHVPAVKGSLSPGSILKRDGAKTRKDRRISFRENPLASMLFFEKLPEPVTKSCRRSMCVYNGGVATHTDGRAGDGESIVVCETARASVGVRGVEMLKSAEETVVVDTVITGAVDEVATQIDTDVKTTENEPETQMDVVCTPAEDETETQMDVVATATENHAETQIDEVAAATEIDVETHLDETISVEEDSENCVDFITPASLELPKPELLDDTSMIYPPLVDCTYKIQDITSKLVTSHWDARFTEQLAEKNVVTVGDFCRLTERELDRLQVKGNSKTATARKILAAYEKKLPKLSQKRVSVMEKLLNDMSLDDMVEALSSQNNVADILKRLGEQYGISEPLPRPSQQNDVIETNSTKQSTLTECLLQDPKTFVTSEVLQKLFKSDPDMLEQFPQPVRQTDIILAIKSNPEAQSTVKQCLLENPKLFITSEVLQNLYKTDPDMLEQFPQPVRQTDIILAIKSNPEAQSTVQQCLLGDPKSFISSKVLQNLYKTDPDMLEQFPQPVRQTDIILAIKSNPEAHSTVQQCLLGDPKSFLTSEVLRNLYKIDPDMLEQFPQPVRQTDIILAIKSNPEAHSTVKECMLEDPKSFITDDMLQILYKTNPDMLEQFPQPIDKQTDNVVKAFSTNDRVRSMVNGSLFENPKSLITDMKRSGILDNIETNNLICKQLNPTHLLSYCNDNKIVPIETQTRNVCAAFPKQSCVKKEVIECIVSKIGPASLIAEYREAGKLDGVEVTQSVCQQLNEGDLLTYVQGSKLVPIETQMDNISKAYLELKSEVSGIRRNQK